MKRTASAPGKIILSGEYAVLFGYPGIAVPAPLTMDVTYEDLALDSKHIPNPNPISVDWVNANEQWHSYAKTIAHHCGITTGMLTIRTELPLGKGMGSSTALVVAMARCLIGDDRTAALKIEDTVNPGHSGLDFAVIWGNTPILFQKGKENSQLQATSYKLQSAVLIDSGAPRESTPELIAWVALRQAQGDTSVIKALATIGRCTERLLSGESLATIIPDHHAAQVALGVVPEQTQLLIKKIVQTFGPAKVIGAGGRTGGGGMILALGID